VSNLAHGRLLFQGPNCGGEVSWPLELGIRQQMIETNVIFCIEQAARPA
jgi:hypothetical protein